MYIPEAFAEHGSNEIAAMVARSGLGVLVTHGPGGLFASHLPVAFEGGLFVSHCARANPHRDLASGEEALLIVSGPQAYVSPSHYPSKAVHGRVVPTWNYEAVHVYGRLSWFEEPERLLALVTRLTDGHEAGRARPWAVGDAPPAYVERLLAGFVGLELRPTRIEAKRKLSQHQNAADREGAISGLAGEHPEISALMRAVSGRGASVQDG